MEEWLAYMNEVAVGSMGPREQVEYWMEARGWSLERVARKIKTDKSKLFRVLRKGQEPDLPMAVGLEDAFGVPIRSWLAEPMKAAA
jgi:transcriptional regulator with XRE-family HTH domain